MNTEPLQPVTQAHIDAYRRDGVALLKGMIDSDWVALLLAEWNRISKSIRDPSDLYRLPPHYVDADPLLKEEIDEIIKSEAAARNVYTEQAPGFIRCKYMQHWSPPYREFIEKSPAAEMVGRTIGARHVRFFFDAMFVKAPACETKTYWHSDHTAWPVKGDQVPTMWMPLLPVRKGVSSLEVIAGSHLRSDEGWPNTYNAKKLGRPASRPAWTDGEKRRDDPNVKILAFDMEPGDAIVLHPNVYHGGGANLDPTLPRIALSTRWFGDDLVWDPRPECINTPGMPLHQMTPGATVHNDTVFPVIWQARS
jgi:ectoine hydroxylase-related dioxygenase (phytanoyl-CoA dioxygenase family)